jgi:hypothetical protein
MRIFSQMPMGYRTASKKQHKHCTMASAAWHPVTAVDLAPTLEHAPKPKRCVASASQ